MLYGNNPMFFHCLALSIYDPYESFHKLNFKKNLSILLKQNI